MGRPGLYRDAFFVLPLHFSLINLESVKVALSLDLQVNQGESPSLNVKNLPPGAYLMRISGTFGFTVAPVVIVR